MNETMSPRERLLAAVNLEPYDRVPVFPHLNLEFPATLAGRPLAGLYTADGALGAYQGMLDLYDRVGGWDGMTIPMGGYVYTPELLTLYGLLYGDTMRYPGADERISATDSPPQFAEREVITPQDYDAIIAEGWNAWCLENLRRISGSVLGRSLDDMSLEQIAASTTAAANLSIQDYAARGIPIIASTVPCDPQMILSLARTLTGFTMDLYRCPDKVVEVLRVISRDLTRSVIESMALMDPPARDGLPGVMVACERGSGAYYNLKVFERFVWPWMKETINAWVEAGYIVTMHLDTDWTRNLPYFLQLPKKKCIAMLDSTTDIFKAKEVLGDHMCIMGDVPPALSTHGSVDDMRTYCERLIREVGRDTGLILGTGCAVPPGTRLENFVAMIESAKSTPPVRSKAA